MKKVKISTREKKWILERSRGQKDVLDFLCNNKSKAYKKKKNTDCIKEFKFKKDDFSLSDFEGCDYVGILRQRLISKSTKAELKLQNLLNILNIKHEIQYPIRASGKLYFADIYVPSVNAIIELDGLYHKSEKVAIADKIRSKHIRKAGFRVIRFDNEEVFDEKTILNKINTRLNLGLNAYQYLWLILLLVSLT